MAHAGGRVNRTLVPLPRRASSTDSLSPLGHRVILPGREAGEFFEDGVGERHVPRPPEGREIPAVLQSGNHGEIARWRRAERARLIDAGLDVLLIDSGTQHPPTVTPEIGRSPMPGS